MSDLTLVDRVVVKFRGDRGGEGPMTLGQRNTFQWMGNLGSERFLSMVEWVFRVPAGVSVDDVAAVWGVLLSRHESLRTVFPGARGADGWPVQRVAESGELAIDVYRVVAGDADPVVVSRELTAVLRGRPFELDRELPVRVAVAAGRDGVCVVVAVYSHMAVDFASMAVLGREFAGLAADPGSRVAGPRDHQPLDQAAAERSPRGRARAEAALRYWQDQLRLRPQCLFAVPETAASETAASETVAPETAVPGGGAGGPLACWLRSPAAALALPHITGRTGASPSMAVLAAVSAVLAHRTGQARCFLTSPSGNRFRGQLRDYVGTLAQDSLIVIDTRTISFDELVRRAGTSTLKAHRHSMFDAIELQRIHDTTGYRRGVALGRDCTIDNLVAFRIDDIQETGTPSDAAGPPAGSIAAAAAALAQATSGWWEPPDMTESLRFDVVNLGAALQLTLWAADIRRGEFRVLLHGIERLLVAAAGGDPGLERLTQITGVEPVARDGDWLCVDSCWVELSAIQRLAEEALPGAAPRVFAVPGPDGQAVVTAYLTGTAAVRTAGQAHAACMRALPGRRTAMAPGWYVLCATAPSDSGDLTGWQHQPVLTTGDGRTHTRDGDR